MKIYRVFYVETEWVPSDVYDDDGYCDDYYDNYVDHDITLGYFANKQAVNKWIDKNENGVIIDEEGNYICSDEDLQIEEIEVIE